MSNIADSRIFLSPPFVGPAERAAVMRAFDSGYVAPCGPQVTEFEHRLAALAGRKYAVALSSGTAAIDLIMEELEIGPEWLVLAPSLAFIATVGPAWHRGAALAFVDSDDSGNVDVALLDRVLDDLAADKRKKLFIGVDLYGRCCDYAAVSRVCRRHGVRFMIDAAESVGATRDGRGSGSAGIAAVYSFNGNKIVTTSGGGALVTDSKGLAARAMKRSQQSRERRLYYEHKTVGYNYRMSNILASIGIAQLDRLDEFLRLRQRNADFYASIATELGVKMLPPVAGENHWLNVMLCPNGAAANRLIRDLAAANIESRPVWKPMHLQPVFRGCQMFGGNVSERLFRCGVCLPSGPSLSESDLGRIGEVIKSSLSRHK